MYDVSDGDPFRFAPFVYQGKGQAGAWDFTAEPLEFNWRDVVSQLDDADFHRASEAGGVQRVHIAPVAVAGRPWMEGGANFCHLLDHDQRRGGNFALEFEGGAPRVVPG